MAAEATTQAARPRSAPGQPRLRAAVGRRRPLRVGLAGDNCGDALARLARTGSPAKAGLTGLARSLAYPLAPVPAGVLADRVSRRTIMVVCATGRAIAMGSVVAALVLGQPSLAQLMVVAVAATASPGLRRVPDPVSPAPG